MSNLFIIGNGFDQAHQLKTGYSDFQNYLIAQYNLTEDEIWGAGIPIEEPTHNGSEYNRRDIVKLVAKLISQVDNENYYWSNVEWGIGEFEYGDLLLTIIESIPDDEDGEFNQYHGAAAMQDYSGIIRKTVTVIHELFNEWIHTINYSDCSIMPNIRDIIKHCENILSFNYTSTIEQKYGGNVFHIHGLIGNTLEFGHGNLGRDFSSYDEGNLFNSASNLRDLHVALYKNTNRILTRHQQYFDALGNLENIYSYGFSYNEIDKIYIEDIINNRTNSNTIWHLHRYIDEEYQKQCKLLIGWGFIGQITYFN